MNKTQHILLLFLLSATAAFQAVASPKNFIVILTDDQGYEDLGCFGSTRLETPHIDQMAKEGMKLTSFYAAASVCTPSRAGLLTGRMPKRAGLPHLLFPDSKDGLSPDEITIAELLKGKGYATTLIGKWHLGHKEEFLPTRQGFDSYYGLPYSNNMTIADDMTIASEVRLNQGYTKEKLHADMELVATFGKNPKGKKLGSKVPLMRNEEVIEYPANQSTLTQRYTEKAVSFIRENREQPFFLFLSHTFPHGPFYVGDDFKGSSGHGDYCDIIQELDWSVGQVLQALRDHNLQEDTLVIFCSDNGPAPPWFSDEPRGSAAPLNGVKFETLEGGQRVPAIAWAPGLIPADTVSDEILSALDLFPTIAHYANIAMPTDRIFDGYDLSAHLEGKSSQSPRNEIYFYTASSPIIDGVRVGDWKYLKKGYKAVKVRTLTDAQKGEKLFNLRDDIGEMTNLIDAYPEKAAELKRRMAMFDDGI